MSCRRTAGLFEDLLTTTAATAAGVAAVALAALPDILAFLAAGALISFTTGLGALPRIRLRQEFKA